MSQEGNEYEGNCIRSLTKLMSAKTTLLTEQGWSGIRSNQRLKTRQIEGTP